MNQTLRDIVAMLDGSDMELRLAAIRVLGALGSDEPAVTGALSKAAESKAPLVRQYALDALGKLGATAGVDSVLESLGEPGDVGRHAAEALKSYGTAAAKHVRPIMKKAPPTTKRVLIDVLASIGTGACLDLLLEFLLDPDFEIVREVCNTIRGRLDGMSAAQRSRLLVRVQKMLTSKAVKGKTRPTVSALILLGHLRDPKARKPLLDHAKPAHPGSVRRYALLGLARIEPAKRLTARDATTLVGYLQEEDFADVVSPTLEALRGIELPETTVRAVAKLAAAENRDLQRFALRALGGFRSAGAMKVLLAALDGDDDELREAAARSLSHQPSAGPALTTLFVKTDNSVRAWTIAKVLKPHAPELKKVSLDAVMRRLKAALKGLAAESGNEELVSACFYVLRHTGRPKLASALVADCKKLASGRSADPAAARMLFAQLARVEVLPLTDRYELAVVGLQLSPKQLQRDHRSADPCLRLVGRLIEEPKLNLARKLAAEGRRLDAETYHYLGFHFGEQLHAHREFGGKMLAHVIKKSPRSKWAAQARSKMNAEGLVE